MELAELKLKFSESGSGAMVGALRSVDSGINQVEKDSHGAGSALKGMFSIAGGVAAAQGIVALGRGVLDLGKGFISVNSNAEQAKMSLEIVTGSAAKANTLFKDLQAFAARTPFGFPELEQAAINLESFGLKTQDWIGVIGDTASAMGKSVDQVTQAVLDAAGGQYERLAELGIKANIEGDQLALHYFKNGKEIVERVDKNNKDIILSTISGIWNDRYAGAMEKQSHTFAGQLSTLKDNINIKMGQIASGVFESLKGLLSFGNDVFAVGWKQALRNAFGVGDTIAEFAGNLGDLAGDIVAAFGSGSPVESILENLPESWRKWVKPLLDIADAFGDLWAAYAPGGEKSGLGGFFAQLGSEVEQLGKAGIDLGTVIIKGAFSLVSNITTDLYSWIKFQLFGGGDPMLQGLPGGEPEIPIGDVLLKIANVAVSAIAGWAADAVTTVQTWLDTNTLTGFTQAIRIDALKPTMSDLAKNDYKRAVADLLTADPIVVTPEMDLKIQTGVANWVRDHKHVSIDFSGVKDILLAGLVLANPAGAIALWAGNSFVPDVLKVLRDGLFGVFSGLFTGPDQFAGFPGMGGSARTVPGANVFQTWSDDLAAWLNANGNALFQPIVDFFTGLPGKVKEGVGGISFDLSGITDGLSTAFDGVASWLSSNTPDWLKALASGDLMGAVNAIFGGGSAPHLMTGAEMAAIAAGNLPATGGYGSAAIAGSAAFSQPSFVGGGGMLTQQLATPVKVPAPDFSAFTGGLKGMATGASNTQTAIVAQFAAIRNGTQALAQAAGAAVTNAFAAMRNAVAGIMESLRAIVAGSLGGLAGMAGAEGYAIGDSLGAGLYAGMMAWATTIANAAAAIVAVSILAARAAAGAHSPSLKMMALGEDMVTGLLIPLHAGRGQVAGAMGDLVALPAAAVGARAAGRASHGAGGGGVTFVFERGAFDGAYLGKGAKAEILEIAAEQTHRIVNREIGARRLGESR